ncbi:hypothetical protein BGZ61DRAFT_553693 [Ilyonectria robusta]|uniref:uncharacterized protein n=1 Tax=Ilyonectria robusta TaxID=1079257 RepID=UPI001E8CC72E|nr:uncharacterized protein BGZ61DRAFT_553693 [Ilyonectria robusta]KAH8735989.1 hypothetical protein BGZ61DRAFT_553693 [Ilyonectria robusta]
MDKTLLASYRSSRRAIRQLCPSPKYVPARIGARRTNSTTASTLIYPEAPTKEHSNLATFLAYVERTGLNKKSTVYRGTHYEYTVAEALSPYGFVLKRVGGASDRGLDLLGTWKPPSTRHVMKVFLQCKAGARSPSPMFVRELKGARAEAPPGWRSDTDVLGLLVGEKPATRGVQEELRASVPLGYVCCSKDGELKQLLWNQAAQEMGLEGVTVAVNNGENDNDGLMDAPPSATITGLLQLPPPRYKPSASTSLASQQPYGSHLWFWQHPGPNYTPFTKNNRPYRQTANLDESRSPRFLFKMAAGGSLVITRARAMSPA